MKVRHVLATALALIALFAAGCGGGDRGALGAETDDPNYRLGKRLLTQGREAEALTAFLKVIETRGERNAPESHLEAGNLCLTHAKDPVEAIHHLKKFLELEPNAREGRFVRERIETAKKEFARSLAGRPEDAAPLVAQSDEVDTLRRENAELKAQIATMRGVAPSPANQTVRTISLPVAGTPPTDVPTVPVTPAKQQEPSPISPAPTTAKRASVEFSGPSSPVQPAPARAASRSPAAVPSTTPTRPGAVATSGGRGFGGRAHTVSEHESLWAIARRYYGGNPSTAQVRGIYDANRGVMKNEGDLRPGMVLKIP